MLKKLQNLLFEDEDDEEEDEEEEKTENVQPAPVQNPVKPAPAPVQQPAQPAAPAMQRIDVEKPAVTASSENIPEKKKQSLGITVDDAPAKKEEVKKPAKPAVAKKPEVKKQEKKKQPAYEFKPVISPIFGVDEKDVNALKTTNQRITRQEREKDRQDANITPIISPMYGPEASSNGARSIDDASANIMDDLDDEPAAPADDLPDFSLDDILKSRDQEFENSKKNLQKDEPVFPDLEDEPLPEVKKDTAEETPADKDDDFFPDLKFDDEEDDTTSVIEKPQLDKRTENK